MFGCGVYSLVGQILSHFRPKLKENIIYCILRRDIMLELTKIGPINIMHYVYPQNAMICQNILILIFYAQSKTT